MPVKAEKGDETNKNQSTIGGFLFPCHAGDCYLESVPGQFLGSLETESLYMQRCCRNDTEDGVGDKSTDVI